MSRNRTSDVGAGLKPARARTRAGPPGCVSRTSLQICRSFEPSARDRRHRDRRHEQEPDIRCRGGFETRPSPHRASLLVVSHGQVYKSAGPLNPLPATAATVTSVMSRNRDIRCRGGFETRPSPAPRRPPGCVSQTSLQICRSFEPSGRDRRHRDQRHEQEPDIRCRGGFETRPSPHRARPPGCVSQTSLQICRSFEPSGRDCRHRDQRHEQEPDIRCRGGFQTRPSPHRAGLRAVSHGQVYKSAGLLNPLAATAATVISVMSRNRTSDVGAGFKPARARTAPGSWLCPHGQVYKSAGLLNPLAATRRHRDQRHEQEPDLRCRGGFQTRPSPHSAGLLVVSHGQVYKSAGLLNPLAATAATVSSVMSQANQSP